MSIVSRIGSAFKDSYIELTQKVTWPTRQEQTRRFFVVLGGFLIIALFVTGVDQIFERALKFIYQALA